jgi:hypothetical protein
METKLEKILLDLNIGYITVKVAKRKILRLFAVIGQNEQLVCPNCDSNNLNKHLSNFNTCYNCDYRWAN